MTRMVFRFLPFIFAGFFGVLPFGAAQAQPGGPNSVEPILASAIPDADGIRRLAVLRALDKITGRAIDIPAPVGVPVQFGTLYITVRYCYTVPPEEPPETSAFLQIDELSFGAPADAEPTRIFSGWMFASSPALNALEHPVYDVWAITCRTDEPEPDPEPGSEFGPGPLLPVIEDVPAASGAVEVADDAAAPPVSVP